MHRDNCVYTNSLGEEFCFKPTNQSSASECQDKGEKGMELFLSDPGVPGPIYGSSCLSLSHKPFADLTDVTLADEDTKSILTDNVNGAIQGNVRKVI